MSFVTRNEDQRGEIAMQSSPFRENLTPSLLFESYLGIGRNQSRQQKTFMRLPWYAAAHKWRIQRSRYAGVCFVRK